MEIFMYSIDVQFAKEHLPHIQHELTRQARFHADHSRVTERDSAREAALSLESSCLECVSLALAGNWRAIQHDINMGILATEAVNQVRRDLNKPRP